MDEPVRGNRVEEFAAGWSDGRLVINVREPWEFEQGHVTVYVICASGNRSLRAAQTLRLSVRQPFRLLAGYPQCRAEPPTRN